MTSLAGPSATWLSRTKIGLTLAFLIGQMPALAAPKEPAPPDLNDGRVIVSTDKGKNPHKHRATKRGPSQPENYASKPQQQIRNLR